MVVLLATACRPPEQAREVLALTNARVVDGNGGPVLDNVTLLIEAGRIALLGPTASVALPSGVRHVDLTGHVVMPGLIDMHYHVITGAMRYTRDSAGRLDSTYDRRLAERLLRTALAHGITTIRDPGASPVGAAIALREAVDSGLVPVCCAWRPGTGRRPSAPLRGGNGGARQTCRPRGAGGGSAGRHSQYQADPLRGAGRKSLPASRPAGRALTLCDGPGGRTTRSRAIQLR